MAKAPIPTEHQEQVAFVSWFKTQYPKYSKAIFCNPNGMHMSGASTEGLSSNVVRAKKMQKLKAEGFKKGVSDIQIPVSKNGYHGLWIEFKRSNGTAKSLSKEQNEHLLLMRELGHKAEWAAGAQVAIKITKEYMDEV